MNQRVVVVLVLLAPICLVALRLFELLLGSETVGVGLADRVLARIVRPSHGAEREHEQRNHYDREDQDGKHSRRRYPMAGRGYLRTKSRRLRSLYFPDKGGSCPSTYASPRSKPM